MRHMSLLWTGLFGDSNSAPRTWTQSRFRQVSQICAETSIITSLRCWSFNRDEASLNHHLHDYSHDITEKQLTDFTSTRWHVIGKTKRERCLFQKVFVSTFLSSHYFLLLCSPFFHPLCPVFSLSVEVFLACSQRSPLDRFVRVD